MATAQEDEGPVCPICVDSFTIPKVLSCGHSYCLACLQDYVGEDDVNNFLCAVCRQQIDVPDDGIEAFPTNYALVKSEPVVTSKCQNHAKKDAECYCRKCQLVLCYKCLHLYHNDHDSLDLESEEDHVTVNEEFSKCENNIRESIDKLKTVSKTLSNTITTYSHDECKKVDDYTKQVTANIQQKADRAKTLIRHKCGEKLSEVEKREDEIIEIAVKAEMELVSVLSSTSNESFLTRVQNLPKLKQLDTKLKEEDIRLPKVEVLEWTPGSIAVPITIGTVQIKPLFFSTPPFLKTEDDILPVETEDQVDDLQVEAADQVDDLQVEAADQGDDLQVDSSGDYDEEPDVQFSFGFLIHSDFVWGYNRGTYYSKDKFCVTALRKLVWSCYTNILGNETVGVYVILLGDENKDIDHCVIDYRLSLPNSYGGETEVLIQEQNTRFDTDVPQGIGHIDIDIWNFDTDEIIFDIIRVKEIVNRV